MTSVIKWVNYRFHLRASQYVLYQILLRSDYAIRMLGKHKKYEENGTVNIGHLSNILFKFHFLYPSSKQRSGAQYFEISFSVKFFKCLSFETHSLQRKFIL